MRKLLLVASLAAVVALAAILAGPVSSGGLFLLRASGGPLSREGLPPDYRPLHKGSVDLATGLYIRENEDLVVHGTPALILRRTYLSRYRQSKQFGIGTTHNGEEYLMGDGERFQRASLVLARGSRINFKRISPGTSFLNAMYLHDETATEWQGARLGWTGFNWTVRLRDGSTSTYRPCGSATTCSITRSVDAQGHAIYYRRDATGRLLKMDGGADRSIAFEYDDSGRIRRAHQNSSRDVRYEYDGRGRLVRVTTSDGLVHRYTYTDFDELATIDEPGTSIENLYQDGRVIKQINRYPRLEPYIFEFTYQLEGNRVVATDTQRSDGSWTRYTWDASRQPATEALGWDGVEAATFEYERDPQTRAITALSLTCADRKGVRLRHSAVVRPGKEEGVKRNLLRSKCFWPSR